MSRATLTVNKDAASEPPEIGDACHTLIDALNRGSGNVLVKIAYEIHTGEPRAVVLVYLDRAANIGAFMQAIQEAMQKRGLDA